MTGANLGSMLNRMFAVDLRSLAALRIALGALVVADVVSRMGFLDVLYLSNGAIPVGLAPESGWSWLPHANGDLYFQGALFLLSGVFGALLLVGLGTRLAAILCLLLLTSLHVATPDLGDAGDRLLRYLLLWGCFLPMGARWSLDAMRGRPTPQASAVSSVASAALLLQFVLLYMVAGGVKASPEWQDGSALSHVFAKHFWARPLGLALAEWPDFLRVLTPLARGFEIVGPLLMLASYAHGALRMGVLIAFWLFQAGLGLTIELNLFPLISTAATLPFLPSGFWDRLGEKLHGFRVRESAAGSAAAEQGGSRLATIFVSLALAIALATAAETLGFVRLPALFSTGVVGAGVHQGWSMYASPPKRDLHYDLSFELGPLVEGAPMPAVVERREQRINQLLQDYRFKYYLQRTASHPERAARIQILLGWICREWNRDAPPAWRLRGSQLTLTIRGIEAGRRVRGHAKTFHGRCVAGDPAEALSPTGGSESAPSDSLE